jgi:PAB-dependent poly(A)-specific ribonuclease subunit 2
VTADGASVTSKAHDLVLARVSVLRGWPPLDSVAFIDDYIAAAEPVVDYVTRTTLLRLRHHHWDACVSVL